VGSQTLVNKREGGRKRGREKGLKVTKTSTKSAIESVIHRVTRKRKKKSLSPRNQGLFFQAIAIWRRRK